MARKGIASRPRRSVIAMLALVLLGACSSTGVRVGPKPPANAALLSTAQGSSCGMLLLNILPMGVNGRAQAAYREAQVALGDRDVSDAKIREHWYGLPLVGTVLCTDVEETAVR